jgi:hypothetical protein
MFAKGAAKKLTVGALSYGRRFGALQVWRLGEYSGARWYPAWDAHSKLNDSLHSKPNERGGAVEYIKQLMYPTSSSGL